MKFHTEYAWQQDPTDLISIAIELMARSSEAHRKVAFLLLDLGVETLFRNYLSASAGITGRSGPGSSSFQVLVTKA